MTCQVSDGGSCWGTIGTWVDPGDDLADAEFEELLVSIAEDVADNADSPPRPLARRSSIRLARPLREDVSHGRKVEQQTVAPSATG